MASDTWTVLGETGTVAAGAGPEPVLDADALAATTGWRPKPEGWCRGDECIPAAMLGDVAVAERVTAAAASTALGAAYAVDDAHRIAVIGSRPSAGSALAAGQAPDLELEGTDGRRHRLFEAEHDKTLVVAFASWCGCRYDLPGWQSLADELGDAGFGVVAVAVDERVEDAAPWAEEVTLPVLVDTDRSFADAYGLTNVPTVLWVDRDRRVVRPPSTEFSDDTFAEVHGFESGPHLRAVRRWVRDDETPDDVAPVADLTDAQRRARAEFRLATELKRRGHDAAAAEHLATADALAPDDLTIWRAGMKLMGDDPFGAEFFDRYVDWQSRHGGPLGGS